MRTRNIINGKVQWFSNENYASNSNAVRCLIESKVKTIKGEIWTNIALGIPYFDKINDKETMDLYITNEINSILEVKEIKSIESTLVNNKYNAVLYVISDNNEEIEVVI